MAKKRESRKKVKDKKTAGLYIDFKTIMSKRSLIQIASQDIHEEESSFFALYFGPLITYAIEECNKFHDGEIPGSQLWYSINNKLESMKEEREWFPLFKFGFLQTVYGHRIMSICKLDTMNPFQFTFTNTANMIAEKFGNIDLTKDDCKFYRLVETDDDFDHFSEHIQLISKSYINIMNGIITPLGFYKHRTEINLRVGKVTIKFNYGSSFQDSRYRPGDESGSLWMLPKEKPLNPNQKFSETQMIYGDPTATPISLSVSISDNEPEDMDPHISGKVSYEGSSPFIFGFRSN